MRKLYTTLLFLLTTSITAIAQNGSLSGKVTSSDNKPVSGATISIQKTQFRTSANEDGAYTFSNIKPANYTVVVTAVGALTERKEITVNEGDMN